MYDIIIIVGNLGRDPEMRYNQDGTPVTSINVATNKSYKDSVGSQNQITKWFRVAVWGAQAEACNQYLRKGSKVLVEGELQADPKTGCPRIWIDKSGNSQASFEVRAKSVKFLSSNSDGSREPEPSNQDGEEIPF